MTQDVLEQLRAPYGYFGRTLRNRAADEIEMLRAKLELSAERNRIMQEIRRKLYKGKNSAKGKSKGKAG